MDILSVIKSLIKESPQVTHVYVAVAAHYLDPKIMPKIESELAKENVKLFSTYFEFYTKDFPVK
jgi:hypothetical protein